MPPIACYSLDHMNILQCCSLIMLLSKLCSVGFLQGPGFSDQSIQDRIANVLSSIPFVLVGCHTMR